VQSAIQETEAASPPIPRRLLLRGIIWILILCAAGICFVQGLHLRRWVFEVTDPIRFLDDIHRGCYWGLKASGPEGYLNQYEKMSPEQPEWKDLRWNIWLDYAPLRLAVMWQWGGWLRVHDPPGVFTPLIDAWRKPWAYTAPVLYFNAAMEALAAIAAFGLTRHWVIRGSGGQRRGHFCGVWQGCAAALLIWFNPAVLVNGYGWPTWDAWVIPWYLLAAWLASAEWWFGAGLAIAVGAMFKGQMLAVAAVFVIWPLVQGRVGAALRWATGALFGFAAIASPWLVSYLPADRAESARQVQKVLPVTLYPSTLFAIPRTLDTGAVVWIGVLLVVLAAAPWIARKFRGVWIFVGAAAIVAAAGWPWMLGRNQHEWLIGLGASAALASAAMLVRPRHQLYVLASAAGAALLGCMDVFHGSAGWWNCAFHFGSIHWPYMIQGLTSNIPGLLQERYQWSHLANDVAFVLPGTQVAVTSKQFFDTIYAMLLVISGIGIGVQARRGDRRTLVALATPWLLFFLFPAQIQERYLLFGAGVAAICIGQSVGAAILCVFLSLVTTIMTLHVMIDHGDVVAFGMNLHRAFPRLFSADCGPLVWKYIRGTHPDIAWGVLVAGGVYFYLSLATPGTHNRAMARRKPSAD
jgi:hypothetical protein